MKLKLLLILFLTNILSFSQDKELIIKQFKKNKEKCQYYTKVGKLDSTAYFLKKNDSILILPLLKDSTYYYQNELLKGVYFTRKSKYEIAMAKLLKATKYFSYQKDSSQYYKGKYNLSVLYYYLNRREEAQKR